MRMYKGPNAYREFIRWLDLEEARTPDGFKWLGTRLNYEELNDMMKEMLT
jgi:hypothetical protein